MTGTAPVASTRQKSQSLEGTVFLVIEECTLAPSSKTSELTTRLKEKTSGVDVFVNA